MTKKLITRRNQILKGVDKILSFCKKINDNVEDAAILIRIEKLEEFWTEFFDIESEICPEVESKEDEFDEDYFEAKEILTKHYNMREPKKENTDQTAIFNRLIEQQKNFFQGMTSHVADTSINNITVAHAHDTVRLPKINIEPFKGDYASWPNFFDLFNCSVHSNANLSNVHKFQILKGLLRDTAAQILEGMNVTDENYQLAYDKLIKRFNKKRPIMNEMISEFLNQPSATDGTVKSMRRLCDFSDKILNGMKSLGNGAENRDPWLIQLLLRKLDADTQEQWSLSIANEDFPTVDKFLNFLSTRCDAREGTIFASKASSSNQSKVKTYHANDTNKSTNVCPKCNYLHSLQRCFKFKKMSVHQRHAFIKQQQLCYNCLKSGHSAPTCPSDFTCRQCHQKHNSLLHIDSNSSHCSSSAPQQSHCLQLSSNCNQPPVSVSHPVAHSSKLESTELKISAPLNKCSTLESKSSQSNKSQCYNALTSLHTLLPTALVYVRDSSGRKQLARVLLDSASTTSFISENLVQRLHLRRFHCTRSVTGIGDTPAGSSKGRVQLSLISRIFPDCEIQLNALILNKVAATIPSVPIFIENQSKIEALPLADPHFCQPAEIDILIGAERALSCFTGERLSLEDHLVAFSSIFGWIVGGETSNSSPYCALSTADDDLNEILQRFWVLEEVPQNAAVNELSDIETHYLSNVSRSETGRYSVKLPFCSKSKNLGDSMRAAFTRLFAMEKRFEKYPNLKLEYCKFMDEYLQLGHMYLTPKNEINLPNDQCYYLPHHCVLKEGSSTSKIRVVFDGSCVTSTGVSLNQNLIVGPTIQDDLVTILIRFRLHPIAFSADIEKMYRQVLVHKEDHQYQRILWRKSKQDPIQHFNLATITYGTSCAPYLAIRTLHKISEDNTNISQSIKDAITSQFYVDDLLSGAETVDQAVTFISEISSALEVGKFNLRKWKTNSTELLAQIPEHLRDTDNIKLFDESLSAIKTLGILWNPLKDMFTFQITLPDQPFLTKRKLLSQIAKVYDPIGWLSPITVSMKIMFQKSWLSKSEWDDPICNSIQKEWFQIRSQLFHLQNLHIPRHLLYSSAIKNCQLHAFCDASEAAYGVVTYLRTETEDGIINVRIIMAKTRVTPLKKVTLPRLELAGATLLSELVNYLKTILNINKLSIKCWCDSQIVLAWLSSNPTRWKPFIANRTSRILELIPRAKWNYIRSKDNPADVASRGILPAALIAFKLWWNGPEWLQLPETEWPNYEPPEVPNVNIEERKVKPKSIVCHAVYTSNNTLEILQKYSSFNKMKRVIARLFLFSKKWRLLNTTGKLQIAENIILQYVQHQSFEREIHAIQSSKPISNDSKLLSLFPYLDERNVLRVGGRIQEAEIPENQRHPAILPKSHPLSKIITTETHLQNLHVGPSLLNSLIKQRYWIIDGRNLARRIYNSCVRCFRFRQQSKSQLMGNLPYSRITPSRPFLHTGVDFAGPIDIKSRKGRGNIPVLKGYIALFICFSTKAVHIEIVSDMATEAYIAALRRFIGRRGLPSKISTDNGTNFVGANNELKNLYSLFKSENNISLIETFLSHQAIEHSFIPARSPHFGGLWEANIKSIKFHLRRVTNTLMTYEEMATLLAQIESLLNSRPLCPMSEDIHDLSALTPGHFLIGAPLTSIPEPTIDHLPESRLSRWQNIQARVQSFWRKWSTEYLHTKQQRYKWNREHDNLKIGDLVIVKEDNVPPSQWLLARVINVHPGKDNKVRVATIKTKSTQLQRPIVKLCRLPQENEEPPAI